MPQRVRPVNSFMISFSSLYHDNDQKTARLALIGLLWLLVKSKNRKARYQVPGKKPEGGGGGIIACTEKSRVFSLQVYEKGREFNS